MLTKKSKNNPMLMEARKVLLNQVMLDTDGHFVVTDEMRFPLWGAADGESKLRFWGVSSRAYDYSSDLSNTKTIYKVENLMGTIGRLINMKSVEGAAACLVKSYIFYPVVLVFYESDDGKLTLSAFSARSLTSPLGVRLAVLKFDKAVDGLASRIGAKRDLTTRLDEFRNRPKGKKIPRASRKKKEEAVEDFFSDGFDNGSEPDPDDFINDSKDDVKLTFTEKRLARKAQKERLRREAAEAEAAAKENDEDVEYTLDDIANMDWSIDQFDDED